MDISQMMGQVQAMKQELEREQQAFQQKTYHVTSANELVKVEVTGAKEIKSIQIKEDILAPDDKEMIEDLIVTTINDAMKMIDEDFAQIMGKYTQGLNLPF